MPDEKQIFILRSIREKIRRREFTESDISNFLINLREIVSKQSDIRELGDFIAHRERNQGKIQQYVLGEYSYYSHQVQPERPAINAFCSDEKALFDLNEALKPISISSLTRSEFNLVKLFFMLIVQDTKIKSTSGEEIAKLVIEINKKSIVLRGSMKDWRGNGINVPIMGIENEYFEMEIDFPFSPSKVVNIAWDSEGKKLFMHTEAQIIIFDNTFK